MANAYAPAEVRFWAKVDPCRTDGCALWLGSIDSQGYGRFNLGGKQIPAHTFLVGQAPEGLEWDHVKERGCTHRNCVWPTHLEAVTHSENTLRSDHWERRKTHCLQGHPYSADNTYERKRKNGGRDCLTCHRERHRRWLARQTAKVVSL